MIKIFLFTEQSGVSQASHVSDICAVLPTTWDADPDIFGKRTAKVVVVSSTELPELLANGDLRVVHGPRDG